MTRRKLDALVRVYEDARYRETAHFVDLQCVMLNAWCRGEGHEEAWTREEWLPPRGSQQYAGKNDWLRNRPEATPEQKAWFKSFQMKAAMAMRSGQFDGPELYPLPS